MMRCSPLFLMKEIDESPVLLDDGADRHWAVGNGIQNLEERSWNLVDAYISWQPLIKWRVIVSKGIIVNGSISV